MRSLGSLELSQRKRVLASLSREDLLAVLDAAHDWHRPPDLGGARDAQLPPRGAWFVWLVQAGRGFGKTRSAAEFIREGCDANGPGWRANIAGRTAGNVRDEMIEGPAGLFGLWPAHRRPRWEPSKRRITTYTGATIHTMSADEPESFRGPQAHRGWGDEIDAWKPKGGVTLRDAWASFELGIRLGDDPRIVATSTPKRGRIVAMLRKRKRGVVVTRGSTLENRANLAAQFLEAVLDEYGGTVLGRQELRGELLATIEGQIVTPEMIDAGRLDTVPLLRRSSVGVDPSGGANEQGIVGAGATACDLECVVFELTGKACPGHLVVLGDETGRRSPSKWAAAAVGLANEIDADAIAAERNFGGDMVESTLHHAHPRTRVRMVHASRGKVVRFGPVGALYEQGRAHHVGTFPKLEDEICGFTMDGFEGEQESPNRADALVWAAFDVLIEKRGSTWADLGYSKEAAASAPAG